MKHALLAAGALVLALSGGAFALGADSPDGTAATLSIAPSGAITAGAPVATAATNTFQQAITALHQERQAYVQAFDWSRGDRAALQADFAGHMKTFDIREFELKRDWYQASGQTELLARAQESLRRLTQPAAVLPQVVANRPAAAPAAVQNPEANR